MRHVVMTNKKHRSEIKEAKHSMEMKKLCIKHKAAS